MKSFCPRGLVLFAALSWSAIPAAAQSGYGASSLLRLPSTVNSASPAVPASYNSPATYDSAFLGPKQASTAAPAAPAPQASTAFDESLHATGWADSGCDECCDPCCGGGSWFGVLGGLVMTRNRGPSVITTYQATTNEPLMSMQDASAGWTGGGEVTLGYAFGGAANVGPWGACGACAGPAVAVTWWGTGEMNGFSQVNDTTNDPATALNASFSFLGVTIDGNPSSFYFEGASSQRIFRTDIANNVEVNLLSGTLISTAKIQVIGLAGFRYFRFSETLAFGSLAFGGDWGGNNGDDEAYLNFRAINSLYGGQLGSIFNYQFAPRWGLFFTPKAGIYGNQMSMQTRLYAGNGATTFDISDHKADVAFLGQIDSGLNYQIRSNLYGYFGYRVLGVSNLALGDQQFTPSFGDIKQSGSLILHGAMFGLVATF